MAVPSPMMKVATTPAQNNPCASANTSTRIAPEHGRRPTATIAESPRCHPPGPASSCRLRRMGMPPGRGMVVVGMIMIAWCRWPCRVIVVVMIVAVVMRMIVLRVIVMVRRRHGGADRGGRWSVRSVVMKARPFTHSNRSPMRMMSA